MVNTMPKPRAPTVDLAPPPQPKIRIQSLDLPEVSLSRIGRPKVSQEFPDTEIYSLTQLKKANDLLTAFTEEHDSFSPNLKVNQRVFKNFSQLPPQLKITAVDVQNHRIQITGDDKKPIVVQLPPNLKVNAKGTGVIYTPPVFAASPKDVLAAAQQVSREQFATTTAKKPTVRYGTQVKDDGKTKIDTVNQQQQMTAPKVATPKAVTTPEAKAPLQVAPTTIQPGMRVMPQQQAAEIVAGQSPEFSAMQAVLYRDTEMKGQVTHATMQTTQKQAQSAANFNQAAAMVGTSQVASQAKEETKEQIQAAEGLANFERANDPRRIKNIAGAGTPGDNRRK